MRNRSFGLWIFGVTCGTALIGFHAGCNPCPLGKQVVATNLDSTPPAAGLVATFPDRQSEQNRSVTDTSAGTTINAGLNELINLVGSASDDQGPKEIRIWVESTVWKTNQQVGPGLLGEPHSHNTARGSSGDKVCTPLLVTDKVRISEFSEPGATAIRLVITAEAVNFAGQNKFTAPLTINWP